MAKALDCFDDFFMNSSRNNIVAMIERSRILFL
jgi:hypothetical protein